MNDLGLVVLSNVSANLKFLLSLISIECSKHTGPFSAQQGWPKEKKKKDNPVKNGEIESGEKCPTEVSPVHDQAGQVSRGPLVLGLLLKAKISTSLVSVTLTIPLHSSPKDPK